MEDLDSARNLPGSAADILRTLEQLGLHWDGEVSYQSRDLSRYAHALDELTRAGLTFECTCSRRELGALDEAGYPGTCRNLAPRGGPAAMRFRVDLSARVAFDDEIQGRCDYALASLSDVIVRRRDGVYAYQLAVVIDDALQGITKVVRGADLLSSTPWQLALQRALGLPAPRYAHVPVIVEPDGAKLAKSRRSVGVSSDSAAATLLQTLALLRLAPPPELAAQTPATILDWATRHWRPERLQGIRTLPLPG